MPCDSKKWDKILSAWEKSGLTSAEFCRQKDLPLSTFYYWKRKLRNVLSRKSELVKIEAKELIAPESPYVLDFSCGVKMTVPVNYNTAFLKRLVSDLQDIL